MTLHIIIILVISLYNNVVYDGNDDGDDGDGDDADADDPQERRGKWSIEFLADDLPQREVEGKQVIIILTRPRPAFGRLGLGGSSRGNSSHG